jgi:hypothetical protein
VYLQPYLTVGDYTESRELAEADTYNLGPYHEDGWNVEDESFSYASVNVNAVYRWEWRNGLGADTLFRNEPQNVLMAKITYWLAI